MLAGLLNLPLGDEAALQWSFVHQDHHRKIINAVFQSSGNLLPSFSFDPMPQIDPQDGNFITWMQNHQASHTSFTSALSIAGNDLSEVDFSRPDQAETWIRLHFQEHYQAQQLLGFAD